MKCKICESEFFPSRRGNITCSEACRKEDFERTMAKQVPIKSTPIQSDEERMEDRWQAIVKNPLAFSHEIIAEVMEWFNARDRVKVGIKMADYLQDRKKWENND